MPEWWQIQPRIRTYNRRMAGEKPIAENRRARHDYHFLERFEAGIVLTGSEVKSLREGRVSLQQSYADVREGEAWLVGAHIDITDRRRAEETVKYVSEIQTRYDAYVALTSDAPAPKKTGQRAAAKFP